MCCYVGNTDHGQYGPVGEQQKTKVATLVPLGNVAAPVVVQGLEVPLGNVAAPVVVQGLEVVVVNGQEVVVNASAEYSNLNMLRL